MVETLKCSNHVMMKQKPGVDASYTHGYLKYLDQFYGLLALASWSTPERLQKISVSLLLLIEAH